MLLVLGTLIVLVINTSFVHLVIIFLKLRPY